MGLVTVQRFGFKVFGRYAAARVHENPRLALMLQRAHITVRPDVYLSTGYLVMLTTVVATGLPSALIALLHFVGVRPLPLPLLVLTIIAPFVIGLAFYSSWMTLPSLRALSRARDIDAKLSYSLNYMATMANAGATPEKIFARLASNPLYGEVSEECAWIQRDLELLGRDVISALSEASDRSPSLKFQDFLQGAITTLTAGGDLKGYLVSKSEQFQAENEQNQNRFLEGLGVIAESYVTVVVAAPLFIIVLLSVLTSFGTSPTDVLTLGYVTVLILVPISQLGFAVSISFMTPEA